jgi:hypothetical protein
MVQNNQLPALGQPVVCGYVGVGEEVEMDIWAMFGRPKYPGNFITSIDVKKN